MIGQLFNNIPPITKNIIIINLIMFGATLVLESIGIPFTKTMALHFYLSDDFRPFQFITHMFMHGGAMHLFFNMFAIFIFGPMLEMRLGPKKYFIFYLITGFGAALLHFGSLYLEYSDLIAAVKELKGAHNLEGLLEVTQTHIKNVGNPHSYNIIAKTYNQIMENNDFTQSQLSLITTHLIDGTLSVVVGASGALFGILAGFAMLYPNQRLMFIFIPYPIKAKYLVIGYAALELFLAFRNDPNDNIAHFAHLGGALFGVILIKFWKEKREI